MGEACGYKLGQILIIWGVCMHNIWELSSRWFSQAVPRRACARARLNVIRLIERVIALPVEISVLVYLSVFFPCLSAVFRISGYSLDPRSLTFFLPVDFVTVLVSCL